MISSIGKLARITLLPFSPSASTCRLILHTMKLGFYGSFHTKVAAMIWGCFAYLSGWTLLSWPYLTLPYLTWPDYLTLPGLKWSGLTWHDLAGLEVTWGDMTWPFPTSSMNALTKGWSLLDEGSLSLRLSASINVLGNDLLQICSTECSFGSKWWVGIGLGLIGSLSPAHTESMNFGYTELRLTCS